jgi:RNA-directed DNA polymerase
MKDDFRQSDGGVVPGKSPNVCKPKEAEGMEGRLPAKGNELQAAMRRTQGRESGMGAVLERIRIAVEREKEDKFTALYHHVYNVDHLREGYFRLRRDAAPGVDGVTWQEYGQGLEKKLQDLSGRLRRGAYRTPPVRRVYIPKADGRQRPLGIPALEDKIVQWVTAQIFSVIWEAEFLGFSYGFRPGRSPHNALDALTVGITRKRVNWVLDADIRGFYDNLSHAWLLKFVQHRIGDKRIVRLIQKWLTAGVLEEGRWTTSEEGAPQGGLISPILANLYLHYVFDLWAHRWRKHNAQGDVILVRYADDFVVGFEHRADAEQFQQDLTERLGEFNLELQAEKTRLIEFGRFAATNREKRGEGKPETFNFLGFTHICGKTRKGSFTVKRQTMRKRLRAKVRAIKIELKHRLHEPVPKQGEWLRSVILGHFRYYGVPMNGPALSEFRQQIIRAWKRALSRRGQNARLTWARMSRLARNWLPTPRIYHLYPSQRLIV